MKRRFLIVLSVCLISNALNAQDTTRHQSVGKIGITFASFGENAVVQKTTLNGAASYTGNQFYSLGINYLVPIRTWLSFETGIEYARHTILIEPMRIPGMESSSYKVYYSMVSIPITVRVNFLRYCFLHGGFLFDMDAGASPIDSQTGIGGYLGAGVNYDFKMGLSVFVNPYFKPHSLLSFTPGENRQRIIETGFRFGMMYTLK